MKWVHGRARVIGAVILLGGCDSAPPRVEPPPPKVSVQLPETRQIAEYDDYNGWLDSPETVEVRSRVRGHIVKVHFTDGDMVKKGIIDPTKVTRTALQNAASIATLLLTTDALVSEIPEEKEKAGAPPMPQY